MKNLGFNYITIIDVDNKIIESYDFEHRCVTVIKEYETRYIGENAVRVLGYFDEEEWEDEGEEGDAKELAFVQEHVVGAPIGGPGEYHYSRDLDGAEHRYTMLVTEEDPFSSKNWPDTVDPYSWIQVEGHLQAAYNLII